MAKGNTNQNVHMGKSEFSGTDRLEVHSSIFPLERCSCVLISLCFVCLFVSLGWGGINLYRQGATLPVNDLTWEWERPVALKD